MTAPGYWMYETTGVLRPVVEKYLRGEQLTDEQLAIMQAYLLQWIVFGQWGGGAELHALEDSLNEMQSHAQLEAWLDRAVALGIDPL